MNCDSFNFVQWPCVVVFTSNLSGQQMGTKSPVLFPKRLSGLYFSLRLPWKDIETSGLEINFFA